MLDIYLNDLIDLAVKTQATDIHFSFSKNKSSIRLRTIRGFQDKKVDDRDLDLYYLLKYKAKLDLAALSLPQTGSFSIKRKEKEWMCRFSCLETLQGKSGVLRILNLAPIQSVSDLTHDKTAINFIQSAFKHTQGLIIISGVTGSGKTTTLYTALSELEGRSIYTLEDPIERYYDSMVQIQINPAIGLDFDTALKQLLRHDPDIFVLSETRSAQEAKAVVRAALSGHLVCTTLHAMSKFSSLDRLMDLGLSRQELSQLPIIICHQHLGVDHLERRAYFDLADRIDTHQYLQSFQS